MTIAPHIPPNLITHYITWNEVRVSKKPGLTLLPRSAAMTLPEANRTTALEQAVYLTLLL